MVTTVISRFDHYFTFQVCYHPRYIVGYPVHEVRDLGALRTLSVFIMIASRCFLGDEDPEDGGRFLRITHLISCFFNRLPDIKVIDRPGGTLI